MTNVIVDAGTDAKIAKFSKRGIEIIGLAVLEPVELCGGLRYEDSTASGAYPTLLSTEGPHTPTSSHLSLSSGHTQESPPPPTPATPTVSAQERAPSGARKLFGKVFKRKDAQSSPSAPRSPLPQLEQTPKPASKRASLLLNPPLSATSHSFPEQPTSNTVLGIQPTVRSPSPGQGFTTQKLRPTCYSWPVQRWLKGPPESLEMPVESVLEVRLDWTRASHSRRTTRGSLRGKRDSILHSNTPSTSSLARRQGSMSPNALSSPPAAPRRSLERSASPARESIRSATTGTDDGSPAPRSRRSRGEDDDDDDVDSDPEDSETPWTCTLVVRRLHVRQHDGTIDHAGDVRVKVAAVVPAPHHPKVVSLLKIPFPLPDLVMVTRWTSQGAQTVEVEARKRIVTPSGVARPAINLPEPGTPTQAGNTTGVGKFAGNFFNTSGKGGRPGTSSGSNGGGGARFNGSVQSEHSSVLLSAEEIKDLVCCTALWLVVREGFGGVGRVKRHGDGWRIRG
jgi:hypothetical protein